MPERIGSPLGNAVASAWVLFAGMYITVISFVPISAEEGNGSVYLDHSLEGYIEYAIENNPDLQAHRARVKAARGEIKASAEIPDPIVSTRFPLRSFPSVGKIGVSQTIPWPGRLFPMYERAGAEYKRETALLATAENEIVQQTRVAFAGLFVVGKTIEYTQASLDLLEQISILVAADYSAGRHPQSALLKIQLEMAVLEDEIRQLESLGERTRDELGRLMNTMVDVPFPDSMPELLVPEDIETAADMAVLQNPEIRAAEFAVLKAEHSLSVADNAFGPSLSLSAEYDPGRESDRVGALDPGTENESSWSVGVGVSVPLWAWSKVGNRSAAASRVDEAKAKLELEKTELTAEVRTMFHSYRDAVRRIEVLEESLLPTAKQTLSVVEEGYANAQVSILDFLDVQRMLLDLEVQRVNQIERRERLAGDIVICCLGSKYVNERTGDR